MKRQFNKIVDWLIRALGSPTALAVATLAVIVWFVTGPIFGFSDTWQLVINTSTTIVTFLMVFVIQNAANRDAKAVHIKLDELITSMEGARNRVVMAENQTEEEQDAEIQRLSEVAQEAERRGAPDDRQSSRRSKRLPRHRRRRAADAADWTCTSSGGRRRHSPSRSIGQVGRAAARTSRRPWRRCSTTARATAAR